MMADHATHDEKVRMVYDELDTRKARSVSVEGFHTTFTRLNIDFTPATVADLFAKADTNKDGVVSYVEFQAFCDTYPTLLDCLYYRSKDYWLDLHQAEAIDLARQKQAELQGREAAAHRAYEAAQQDTAAQEHALELAMRNIADAEARETDARSQLEQAQQDTEGARADHRARIGEMQGAKENERNKASQVADAKRDVDVQHQRVQMADAETAKAEDRLRELERLIQEQRQELDNRALAAAHCRDDLAAAQVKEESARAAHEDALHMVEDAKNNVMVAEQILADRQERERTAANLLRDASNETARALQQRDAEQRELAQMKDKENRAKYEADVASQVCDEHDKHLQDLVNENAEHNAKRSQVQEEEKALLEQEVRLREQRDCLESKESELRERFSHFTSASRTPPNLSSPQGGSRYGSPYSVSPVRPLFDRSPSRSDGGRL